jgi:hypothetical protein
LKQVSLALELSSWASRGLLALLNGLEIETLKFAILEIYSIHTRMDGRAEALPDYFAKARALKHQRQQFRIVRPKMLSVLAHHVIDPINRRVNLLRE